MVQPEKEKVPERKGTRLLSFDNLNLPHNDLNLQHLKPTDFNDLHQIAGLSAVRNQIENSIHIVEKHHEIEI